MFPRNCGLDGPVVLLEADANAYLTARRAGAHYLVVHSADLTTIESFAIDRCGESKVLLQSATPNPSPTFGVAGEWILSCDEPTGEMAWIDPTGVAPPRVIFESVEACRVVSIGGGLAAQATGSGVVWFHPDPSDPEARRVVVTESARVADPEWIHCVDDFECRSHHPYGLDIRAAGDELLVVSEAAELLEFSPRTLATRVLDPGPVQAIDLLADPRRVIVDRDLGPTFVLDRETGAAFEFCCLSTYEPPRQLGDWLVKGNLLSPMYPPPPQWTIFQARHLGTGAALELEGRDDWSPQVGLTDDTIVADIRPEGGDYRRHVVWPATGERRAIDFPGRAMWTQRDRDGAWAWDNEGGLDLHVLDGPDARARRLLEDVRVVYPTRDGRIVFEDFVDHLEPTTLSVMLPDERIIELDAHAVGAYGLAYWSTPWPVDEDEVAWVAEEAGRWVVRRTVLP